MKAITNISIFLLIFVASQKILADTHYVSKTGANVPPFTNWTNAANVIQDAVDIAVSNDIVLVNDGVYDTGGAVTPGYSCSNRVVIKNDITVKSLNGPEKTTILGKGPLGSNAVRGVYMSAGILDGFTVSNGHTRTSDNYAYDRKGGGVNMYGGNGVVTNCTISGNSAGEEGGGTCYGTVNNCIIWGNSATISNNYYRSTILYSCTAPLPGGPGNISANPKFLSASDFHLQASSPCIDAGTNLPYVYTTTDLDGNPRLLGDRVDMGAYEYIPEPGVLWIMTAFGALLCKRKT